MDTLITKEIIQNYLQCRYKGFLKFRGQIGFKSNYEIWLDESKEKFKFKAISEIIAKYPKDSVLQNLSITDAILRQGTLLLLDVVLNDEILSLHIDGLKRESGESQLGSFHYIPILFNDGDNVYKEQKYLLALCSIILNHLQGRQPQNGIVINSPKCKIKKIKLEPYFHNAQRVFKEIKHLYDTTTSLRLVLNKHCNVCEFQQRCNAEALEKDDISLLKGISEKEINKQNRKGIFTITQLSCTFRPRKLSKRGKLHKQPHYFALKALAIKEKKTYLFGTPDLPSNLVRIYFDVEGDPERKFVYLIGMIIVVNEIENRYSLWADNIDQEPEIFEQFLDIINRYDNFCLFHYGNYEITFLKRMKKHFTEKSFIDKVINGSINVLSLIYSYIYFPTYSNGLKEIGKHLGCTWSDENATGLQSIVWRRRWETTYDEVLKQKLITYNFDDCEALKKITEFIYSVNTKNRIPNSSQASDDKGSEIAWVQDISQQTGRREWGRAHFFFPEFDYINKCAYFDYQREKVFIRTSKTIKRIHTQKYTIPKTKRLRVNKTIKIRSLKCPFCSSKQIVRNNNSMHTKIAYDLKISSNGITRQTIACTAALHKCIECKKKFLPRRYKRRDKYFNGVKSWAMYQHVAHRVSLENIENSIKESFGLYISHIDLHMYKALMSKYHLQTYNRLIRKILAGNIIHVDETNVALQTSKGYVWVFTNLEEVVFMYKPTREGEFVKDLLEGYNGVLISDFYSAYDSLACAQQKCLIHLIRDFNHDILTNPYDEEFKLLAHDFGRLLRSIISTIDQYGLRQKYLEKHTTEVELFYKALIDKHYNSELSEKYQKRLIKYQDKLFTFLKHNGVPWNNNNAEHAIKQFAHSRMISNGKMRESGLKEFLVLLSIYLTCKYKGISFLTFLLSQERDIDKFCQKKSKRYKRPYLEVYPDGFPRRYQKRTSRLNAEIQKV